MFSGWLLQVKRIEMRSAIFIILALIVTIICFEQIHSNSKQELQVVNPVLGDLSFSAIFGFSPERADGEFRVLTHLRYVHSKLSAVNVSHLDQHLRFRRTDMLNLLAAYIEVGQFPHNYDFPGERKPCFIDRDGRICAVGYLVAQTEGLSAAGAINDRFQYHNLLDIKDTALDSWIAESGLTKLECAMIQPAYGPPPPAYNNGYISTSYGLPSAILGGVNIAMCTVNGVQIAHGSKSDAMAIAAMVTGAGQIVLGAANYSDSFEYDFNGFYRNKSKNALSLINIGFGAAAFTLGTINLFVKKGPNEKLTSWNLYTYPADDGNQGLALVWRKRF